MFWINPFISDTCRKYYTVTFMPVEVKALKPSLFDSRVGLGSFPTSATPQLMLGHCGAGIVAIKTAGFPCAL